MIFNFTGTSANILKLMQFQDGNTVHELQTTLTNIVFALLNLEVIDLSIWTAIKD